MTKRCIFDALLYDEAGFLVMKECIFDAFYMKMQVFLWRDEGVYI